MRFVAYLRVSTDDQAESGAGLKAQLDACRNHAERQGGELAGPYADEGISGAASLDRRPALMDALAALGRGDALLVAKRDRLGRDPIAVATIEAAVARSGCRVISAAGEGTGDDDPASVLMRRLIDAFAEYERLIIKARTRAALGAKRRRGERVGRVPFGYRLDAADARRSKKGNPSALVECPEEQAILRDVRIRAADGIGPARIAADLQSRGVATKTGARWSAAAVRRLIARPEPASVDARRVLSEAASPA